MLDAALILLGFLTWGGHVSAPWRLAGAAADRQRLWRISALPALLAGTLVFFASLLAHPDRAVAGGLATFPGGNGFSQFLTILLLAALAIDLLVLFAGDRLETIGWRLAAVGCLPLLVGVGLAGEVMRVGDGPLGEPLLVWPAVLARSLVALAAGDLWVGQRPFWSPAAGLAVPLYAATLPGPLRGGLWQLGFATTALAATVLLLAARWLPERYQRISLVCGLAFAALFLSQAAAFSEVLSGVLP